MEEVISPAIYLAGNKKKLINDLHPHLKGFKELWEPFAGSAAVSLNMMHRGLFERSFCNDIHPQMVELHECIKDRPQFIRDCFVTNEMYPENKDAYLKMRDDYNLTKDNPVLLFNLMMRSNNNMIRFSGANNDKFNVPFGERHRFDLERIVQHKLLSKDIEWSSMGFSAFLSKMVKGLDKPEDVVVYFDCPYSISDAVYNKSGTGWNQQDDIICLDWLLKLWELGVKVVYSNVFFNKGKTFDLLIEWCEEHSDKFEVIHLDRDYNNCSSFKYEGVKSDEVLIVSK